MMLTKLCQKDIPGCILEVVDTAEPVFFLQFAAKAHGSDPGGPKEQRVLQPTIIFLDSRSRTTELRAQGNHLRE